MHRKSVVGFVSFCFIPLAGMLAGCPQGEITELQGTWYPTAGAKVTEDSFESLVHDLSLELPTAMKGAEPAQEALVAITFDHEQILLGLGFRESQTHDGLPTGPGPRPRMKQDQEEKQAKTVTVTLIGDFEFEGPFNLDTASEPKGFDFNLTEVTKFELAIEVESTGLTPSEMAELEQITNEIRQELEDMTPEFQQQFETEYLDLPLAPATYLLMDGVLLLAMGDEGDTERPSLAEAIEFTMTPPGGEGEGEGEGEVIGTEPNGRYKPTFTQYPFYQFNFKNDGSYTMSSSCPGDQPACGPIHVQSYGDWYVDLTVLPSRLALVPVEYSIDSTPIDPEDIMVQLFLFTVEGERTVLDPEIMMIEFQGETTPEEFFSQSFDPEEHFANELVNPVELEWTFVRVKSTHNP